jgi:cytochrome oxidase Cu insertion factor (SCO1/SenC/PrrC family)
LSIIRFLCYKKKKIISKYRRQTGKKMERKRSWRAGGLLAWRWVILLTMAIPGLVSPLNGSAASNFYSYSKPLPVPDFSLENLQGKRVHIKDFRGQVVLLHFWATW